MKYWLPITISAWLYLSPPGLGQEPEPSLKRVEVDKTTQTLRAYEGEKLVLQCPVSTGRWDGATPNGSFTVQEKSRLHFSRLFHHAPMPYSAWITGNVFIHGFTSVPPYPASHGCIRVPLTGDNPAKRLYEWMEVGTPVTITGHWAPRSRRTASRGSPVFKPIPG